MAPRSLSENRRAILKKRESARNFSSNISNLNPIQRYYQTAESIKSRHDQAVKTNRLDDAYVFGLRFAMLSTEGLPNHGYYHVNQPEYVQLRKKNEKDLHDVITSLENVKISMDFEEMEREEIRRREEKAMQTIRHREEKMRQEEKERRETQELIDRLAQLDMKSHSKSAITDESSTANHVAAPVPAPAVVPPTPPVPSYASAIAKPVSAPSYASALTSKSASASAPPLEPTTDDLPISDDLPLPMPAPIPYSNVYPSQPANANAPTVATAPPPSYDDLVKNLVPASAEEHGDVENKMPAPIVPLQQRKTYCQFEYSNLKKKNQIQVFQLSTYQGRSTRKDSTNGCTVISPLVAVHHLQSPGAGISDMKIESIIDDVAPDILHRVRRKLGLEGHALIIPSDVHDFMHDQKILNDDMFVGVCGGNLLDLDHVNEFINLLMNGEDANPSASEDAVREEKKDMSRKVAAALFFHEHVVSILKVVLADGTMWYDFVDSLPTRSTANGMESIGATRTRCKDRASLYALLNWYACQKFSPADEKYIDANEWDDTMVDFDPRVFQGFVWKA